LRYELLKGVIIRNLLYLVMFYIIYFPLVATAFYAKDQICGVETFTTYCDNIPASTTMALNFIMYVVLPLGALLWAVMSMSAPSYEQYR
jgi:hypothetical protein